MAIKFVYKVVSDWNAITGVARSACIKRGAACLEYRIGEETEALPGTVGIVVYCTEVEALNSTLMTYGNYTAIFKCVYSGELRIVDKNKWRYYEELFNLDTPERLLAWVNDQSKIVMENWYNTYRVDSILPVKIIKVISRCTDQERLLYC
jgi:hypothetical protein